MYVLLCAENIDVERILKEYCMQNPDASSWIRSCSSEEELQEALEKIQDYDRKLAVKTKNGVRIVPFSQITFCWCKGHVYHVQLRSGEQVDSLTIRCSFVKAVAPLLESGDFIQCNASAVVRISEIKMYYEDSLQLYDGTELPFPAKRRAALQHLW